MTSGKFKPVRISQISGYSGQLLGSVPVRKWGTASIKVSGSMLYAQEEQLFGIEVREIHIPLRNITSIDLGSGCIWWLFWVGIVTSFIYIGIVLIIISLIAKQHYIAVLLLLRYTRVYGTNGAMRLTAHKGVTRNS
jgi:hypothetical protein